MQGNNVMFYKIINFKFSILVNRGFYKLLVILWKPNKLKY